MSKIPDVDFIGLFNHIYNNRPLKDFRCNRDRRLRVKFKASTTDGLNYENEPGVPSYKRRLRAFEKLRDLGFNVKMYNTNRKHLRLVA